MEEEGRIENQGSRKEKKMIVKVREDWLREIARGIGKRYQR